MTFEFDQAIEHVALGDGVYDTPIRPGWEIGIGVNGGYLMSLIANAMRAAAGREAPLTVTVHYLSPASAGPARTRTQVLKSGRRYTTVSATLERDGKPIITALGTFGDEIHDTRGEWNLKTAPALPAFNDCPYRKAPDNTGGLVSRLALRFHPDDVGMFQGNISGVPRLRSWFTFADDRPVDPMALLLASDVMPPVAFNVLGYGAGPMPTIELTVHVLGVPAPGPMMLTMESSIVSGNVFEEDAEIWDSAGKCVAVSRQVAVLTRAPSA